MLNEQYINAAPHWAERCELFTMSRLLKLMADPKTHHVYTRIFGMQAFIVIMQRVNKASHFTYGRIHRELWLSAHHTTYTPPGPCHCWICRWRKRRNQYLNLRVFDHLLEQRPTSTALGYEIDHNIMAAMYHA